MRDQQDLSDFLLKIVLWVLLVLNLRTNGSNSVLNKASGFMGSCGRKTFYFKFLSIQKQCLSTEPFSPASGWKNIFHFINHMLSKQCCSRHAVRSVGSAQSSWYCDSTGVSLCLGAMLRGVGLGVMVGVCVTQGTCVTRTLGRAGITSICFTKGPTKLCLTGYGQGGRSLLCCLILKLLQLYMHIP